MKRTEDFFIADNKVKLADELDYSRVGEYIHSAESFSRSTFQSVYIIDYFKQNFLYVSPNPLLFFNLLTIDVFQKHETLHKIIGKTANSAKLALEKRQNYD